MNMDPTVPRRPDGTAPPPLAHGVAAPPPGNPIPPGAPTSPIVHGPPPGWTPTGAPAPPHAPGTPPGEAAGTYRTDGVYRGDRAPAPGGERPLAPHAQQAAGSGPAPTPTPDAQRAFAPGAGAVGGSASGPASAPLPGVGDEPGAVTGPMGVRETSGVQVRLGTRGGRGRRERARAERAAGERPGPGEHPGERPGKRAGKRAGIVAGGVVALAALVMAGVVLSSSTREGEAGNAAFGGEGGERPNGTASVPLPEAGKPVEVGTADGSRYRIAAVTAGVSDGTMPSTHSAAPSGTSYPYIEYLLTNPKDERVLLDFPGDVFVKAELVAADARGRCMPQAGVPEEMCTPPTRSRVVKTLVGGEPIQGEGGDKWMPPGSSYLVRATVTVPVDRRIDGTDLGLYIWKQLYMNDQLAKPAPFPS
ncbi:hypothetical protein [Actinomadura sediminis]|uniref:Serine/threonine protein kinase n=1 Tax=Actinomadura sediminis TaxID=1038904 RepID=A0ABW3ESR4_9ACTN